jgi:UDP-N-acetylmuramoyl-L-alanyl-D-glutamate--2,6-diaminopimelate ligase
MKMQNIKNIYHLFQAVLACSLYGFPSRRLKVIGVTGTDGKTTTTHLIHAILKQAGKKVAMSSTVSVAGLHTTTPNPFAVQKMLKLSADQGDEYFILETTSHALDQNRVWGVSYAIGVITNITHEHLDYHGTYLQYLRAKAKLFTRSKVSLINRDDSSFDELEKILKREGRIYMTYSLKHDADFTFNYKKRVDDSIPEFNNYNYLAAYGVAKILGVDEDVIITATKQYKLPSGRLEEVYRGPFRVIVDFAHTPNAIEQLLKALKNSLGKSGKLIHVFGSAGLRDHDKRPFMGKVSSKFADHIILTEEDYRTEDPQKIAEEIATGISEKKYEILLDREQAIDTALKMAKKGDIVVITGKGHEQSLARGEAEFPWDDREAVRNYLRKHP